jgi:hypothetical protein
VFTKVLDDAKKIQMLPVTLSDRKKGIFVLKYGSKTEWSNFMKEIGEEQVEQGLTKHKTPLHIVRLAVLIGTAMNEAQRFLKMCSRKFDAMKADVNNEFPSEMADIIVAKAVARHSVTTFARYATIITVLDRVNEVPVFNQEVKTLIVDWLDMLHQHMIEFKNIYREILRIKEQTVLRELMQARNTVEEVHPSNDTSATAVGFDDE